jgi:hypothetical protein
MARKAATYTRMGADQEIADRSDDLVNFLQRVGEALALGEQ